MITSKSMCKITISLPDELVVFADERARELSTSRSQVIGLALAAVKAREEELSAASGYRFYAQEASEFAAAAQQAAAETWPDEWMATNHESIE